MGVAMTGLNTECANIREHAFFKYTWYQHFVFYQIFHRKRGLPLFTEASAYCVKEQAVEIWPIKNSALCYVNVGLPGLTLFRMEQMWSSSTWFSWSLFKHSPAASREDFKLNLSLCPIPPPKRKKKSADYITVLSMNVQKAKNCSFLVSVPVPRWFNPESAKSNWLKIAKQ